MAQDATSPDASVPLEPGGDQRSAGQGQNEATVETRRSDIQGGFSSLSDLSGLVAS